MMKIILFILGGTITFILSFYSEFDIKIRKEKSPLYDRIVLYYGKRYELETKSIVLWKKKH